MFYECATFNHPLNSWDVSSVENTESMFHNCKGFTYSLNDKEKCEQITYHTIILSMKQ